LGLLFAALLLAGCDHHKAASQADSSAGVSGDSDLTGEHPAYPRALPVTLPAAPAVATTAPAASVPPTAPATPSDAPATPPPSDTPPPLHAPMASAPTSTADAAPSSSPPPGDIATTPAPTASPPDTGTDMPRLAMTPPAPQVATLPPPAADPLDARKQVAILNTSFGRMVIEMDDVAAPRTCGNFRKLISDGFYNHTTFHRVIPNFIIQGGDPNSRSDDRATYGQGDPGYTLPAEIKLNDDAGAVAMARLPDSVNPQQESNGSQFFICVAPCPSLDGKYTVFAHVIRGIEVARKIANQPRDARDNPNDRIEMELSLEPKSQALEETTAGQ
jgi:peptidyl-prolyl cis-trans isomerase B (cyclophilin B)